VKPEYWQERWREGRIGFHRADVNPLLVDHHGPLGECLRLLVPLCGKSADLEWLAMQGHEVVGVELSELAAQAFFAERQLTPTRRESGAFTEYRHGLVAIWVGDFFALSEAVVDSFDGAYDRAALIALPEELRPSYAGKLRELMRPKARLLLVTLHFDAEGGPPFSVTSEEISALYSGARVARLSSSDAFSETPGPVERGASFVSENVDLIEFG
jgi:thiopurine S-methyltransferase